MRISDWSSDVCSSDLLLNLLPAQVTRKRSQYRTGMDGKGANAVLRAARVERDGEEGVCRLGLAVRQPFVVGAAPEIEICQVESAELVRARRHDDHARAAGCTPRPRPERGGLPQLTGIISRALAYPPRRGARAARRGERSEGQE